MSKKISELPEYIGIPQPVGDIPISINGTTYKIKPSLLSSGTLTLDNVLANGNQTGRNIDTVGTIGALTSKNILSDTGNSATLLNPTIGQTNYYGNYGVYGSSIITKVFGAPDGQAMLTNTNSQTPTSISLVRGQYDDNNLSMLQLSNSNDPFILFGKYDDNFTTLKATWGGSGLSHTFNLPNKGGGTYTLATLDDIVGGGGGGSVGTIQQVLTNGSTSTLSLSFTYLDYVTTISGFLVKIEDLATDEYIRMSIGDGLSLRNVDGYISKILNTNAGANNTFQLPNKTAGTYTIATTADVVTSADADKDYLLITSFRTLYNY